MTDDAAASADDSPSPAGSRDEAWAEALLDDVVDLLRLGETIRSDAVERAVRAVPRHRFASETLVEEVYDPYVAVPVAAAEHGGTLAPLSIQIMLLEEAGIAPRARVGECGSGGYAAALARELVGPRGEVVSIAAPGGTDRVNRLLTEAGYDDVRVVHAGTEGPVPGLEPLDVLLINESVWEVPPEWGRWLAADGRLVLPLQIKGLTLAIAFDRAGDRLVSTSVQHCDYAFPDSAAAHGPVFVGVGDLAFRFDDEGPLQPQKLHRLGRAPSAERAEIWTGVHMVPPESVVPLLLYLAAHLPGFCTMTAAPGVDDHGPEELPVPAVLVGASFAGLVMRPAAESAESFEFGVQGFGPERQEVTGLMASCVRAWNELRHTAPRITIVPADTPEDRMPAGQVIEKVHSTVVLSWSPAARCPQGG
ncbi:methyltransferase, FxLD system [Streptomyces luteireticuli]|uniref:methyltransferase, FxLD system n=1 Tax=Streptomyces luteireticuli TaxID=173858 RepID=UPI003556C94C